MTAILAILSSAAPLNVLELIGGLALGLMVIVAVAAVARRLLGVRVGAVRLLVAGVVGYTMAALVSTSMERADVPPYAVASILIGIQILVTMACLVAAEALIPSGSRPLRDLRRRLARARRYGQITAIAMHHGLGPYLRGRRRTPEGRDRLARSLRLALEEGGVTFVKLGQLLSTRPDLLPREVIDELERLQAQVTPAPWPEVEAVVVPVRGEFAAFDREPLAAASIAQVHAARLRSGENVVVKIQRPGIEPVVERDLDIVLRLARTIEARQRRGLAPHATIETHSVARLNAVELARGFAVAIREELDFRVEARNLAAVGAAAERHENGLVRLPALHEALSGRRVLVMERLDGVPIVAAEAALDDGGLDRAALAHALLDFILRQIMIDGVFHADPHAGNVLLLADGGLGLLDFGSVGRLDPIMRGTLTQLLIAIDRGEPDGMANALLELAQWPDEVVEQRLARAVGRFMARHLAAGVAPSPAMFSDLLALIAEHGLTVPPEAAGAFRALATLEGTLRRIDPSFDMVADARAIARKQLDARSAGDAVRDELLAAAPIVRRLPRRLDRITAALEHGHLSINVRQLADERDRRVITALVHQVLLAFLGATTGLMGVLLLGAQGGPDVTQNITLFQLLGYNLLVVSLLLMLRVLFILFRPERQP